MMECSNTGKMENGMENGNVLLSSLSPLFETSLSSLLRMATYKDYLF